MPMRAETAGRSARRRYVDWLGLAGIVRNSVTNLHSEIFFMLDAFRTWTNGKEKLAQQQTDLETLIANAREERSALSAMLTYLTARSVELVPIGKSLEQVTEKANGITTRLDEIAKRLAALDERTKELETVEKRVQALKVTVWQVERSTDKALGTDGALHKHRQAVQQLTAQALQTQSSLDTLKKERSALEELRSQLRTATTEVKQSISEAGMLNAELDQVRAVATVL